MIKSISSAVAGMIVQQKKQENVANNLANAETSSFKAQTVIASAANEIEYYSQLKNGNMVEVNSLGLMPSGVEISDVSTDFTQGIITESDRELDFAIDGNGFFNIQMENGNTGYTRNGSLGIDQDSYLINSQGYFLVGKDTSTGLNGKIKVNDDDCNIQSDGAILDKNGIVKFTLMMSDFIDYDGLDNLGNGVYLNVPLDGYNKEIMADDFKLISGSKESANVNVLDEMVKMIEISRAFESNQRVIQSADEMLSKVVNDIGRV